jgi:hypothetical protein
VNDRDILLADLQTGNTQSSIDMESLFRFARATLADEHVMLYLRFLCNGHQMPTIDWGSYARLYGVQEPLRVARRAESLDRRRKRALAQLVRDGICEAWWVGTGEFGRNDVGVNRVRCWGLRPS